MAPIPEDNQEKPPSRDDDEFDSFPNGNLAPVTFGSDSSDENDDNYPDTTGYMLLPQEPGVDIDDYDSDNNNENIENTASSHFSEHTDSDRQSELVDNVSGNSNSVIPDHLPDEVIQSEGGAIAPTVTASSTSLHPEFLAKFPDGKVPSYMQVPDIPSKSKDALWNKKRTENNSSLETAEEKNIIKAMSGFSLPTENVPDWAKNISEDQWNNVISNQIKPEEISDSSSPTLQKQEDWVAEFPDS